MLVQMFKFIHFYTAQNANCEKKGTVSFFQYFADFCFGLVFSKFSLYHIVIFSFPLHALLSLVFAQSILLLSKFLSHMSLWGNTHLLKKSLSQNQRYFGYIGYPCICQSSPSQLLFEKERKKQRDHSIMLQILVYSLMINMVT